MAEELARRDLTPHGFGKLAGEENKNAVNNAITKPLTPKWIDDKLPGWLDALELNKERRRLIEWAALLAICPIEVEQAWLSTVGPLAPKHQR